MANYVIIDLDTTSPIIEIHSPNYTTNNIINEIIIESNETLSNFQEIYLIDSNSNRYDYTFNRKSEKEFVGNIDFSIFPMGIVTIFARMQDEVGNMSELISKSIHIREDVSGLLIEINDRVSNIKINDRVRRIDVEVKKDNGK